MVCEDIPENAKQCVIVTLPKPGKTHYNKRESYRGITLLTAFYKLERDPESLKTRGRSL